MRVVKKILKHALLLLAALILMAVGYYFAVTKDAVLCDEKLLLAHKNFSIYDKDGLLIENCGALLGKQTVEGTDIPIKTKWAFVDTEDKRFFTHGGFDVKRIGGAAWKNVKSKTFKEGASTISQQLIKNTHLTQEKTFKRKLQEWKLTRALECNYSKDEILEKYLNTIYFGHNCFGLRSACEFYFQKTPSDLTLADSAILAGLVKSPNNYSPFKHPERCKKRKAAVLSAMHKNGHITQAEVSNALAEPLPTANERLRHNDSYMHFLFEELTDISEQFHLTLGGHIEIFTYMDADLQKTLAACAQKLTDCDKCLLSFDSETAGFSACVSTIGDIERLPGSLIKPLLVYAPALEENLISPATPILDEAVDYSGYKPENYDKKTRGYVSARECVAQSLNIPAVKILQSLGVKKAAAYLEEMNLTVANEDLSLALALGGMKKGFRLKDILSAYATFQNSGVYQNGAFIDKIKIDGQTVYQRKHSKKRVFSEETAYLMTDMLKTASTTGTAKKLRSLPFDIAAKTGTVGTENGNTDAYALSYTSKNCFGVWLGNADNSFIDYTGGGLPCNLLYEINTHINERYQAKDTVIPSFSMPSGVKRVSLDKSTYYDTHTMLGADPESPLEFQLFELFKKENIPMKKCDLFSNPSISTPVLTVNENGITISFNKGTPVCYDYKIERYDYATHSTIYFGEFLPYFTDTDIQPNKRYVYYVTPYYKGKAGKKITLPTATTKQGEPIINEEILQKDWWKY